MTVQDFKAAAIQGNQDFVFYKQILCHNHLVM